MHIYNLDTYQVVVSETYDIGKLYLELTSRCNFECEMCFRHNFTDSFGDMNDQVVDRVKQGIEDMPKLESVVFGGMGESLLHPRTSELISFVKAKGISVTVSTNGHFLSQFIDCFVENKVNRVVVSFEPGEVGHPPEEQLWDAIAALAKRRDEKGLYIPMISLELVVTKANVQEIDSLRMKIIDSGIGEVLINNLLPINEKMSRLTLYPDNEPDIIKKFRTNLSGKFIAFAPNFEIKTERNCSFVDSKAAVVRWDGEVAPCYRFMHAGCEIVLDKEKEIIPVSFGNVLNKSLKDIWNEREYVWFRYCVQNSRYPSCIDCDLRDGCQYTEDTASDCWGTENTCADCLWERGIIVCP